MHIPIGRPDVIVYAVCAWQETEDNLIKRWKAMHALFRQTSAKAGACNPKKKQWSRLDRFRTALDAPIIACADQSIARYGNIKALGRSSGWRSAWRYARSFVGEAGACVQ